MPFFLKNSRLKVYMLAWLSGKIKSKGAGFIIIEANNVGYKVFISPVVYADLASGQLIDLYTHQYVREDVLDLYGFKTIAELELFELLLSISGIGPKSALGVLSISKVSDIKDSIARGDSALLTKVSGIGRKTAERVILELREKIGQTDVALGKSGKGALGSGDEIDALMALGYSLVQARQALQAVDSSIKDSGERIKQALRKLGR